MEKEIREIQIDPPHRLRNKIIRALSLCFMVAIFLGVMGSVVWYFVFSSAGPRWADDFAGTRHRTDKSEVTLYTPMQLNLNEVAIVMNKGDKTSLKAFVSNVPGSHAKLSTADVKVRWYSECPSVAKVSANGRVTAIGKGTAFVYCVIENDNINANAAHCLITVKDGSRPVLSTAKKVFGGAAVYDVDRGTISFLSSKTIEMHGTSNQSITMSPGDRITDVQVTDTGHLISGKFVMGNTSKSIKGLHVKM